MEKVGKDGVITVEEGKGIETTLEVVEGMQFDRATSRPTSSPTPSGWRPCWRTPYILIHEKKISRHEGPAPAAGEGRASWASRC